MCPIVPTFRCGLLRSNFSFAISVHPRIKAARPLSRAIYKSFRPLLNRTLEPSITAEHTLERGTGFEPATICLEGRDSTPELPPLIRLLNSLISARGLGTRSLGSRLYRCP